MKNINESSLDKLIEQLQDKTISNDQFKHKLLEILNVDNPNDITEIQQSVNQINNYDNIKDYANIVPLVQVKNLTKKYKGRTQPAINDVSFDIYPGEFHVFIGANGAGKTTTIKSIIGAYSKSHYTGEIMIGGYSNECATTKAILGYIPEEAKFPKKMNAKTYLYLMTRLSGFDATQAKQKVEKVLKELNLESLAKKCPESFSSGQKKKILLAQALIHEPHVLIMDEPAANLDPLARHELFELLVHLQKNGKAIFLSSHILDEVGRYATFTTIVDGGKIVFNGPINVGTRLIDLYKKYVQIGSVDTKK